MTAGRPQARTSHDLGRGRLRRRRRDHRRGCRRATCSPAPRLAPGEDVLDVAAGTGNIVAARRRRGRPGRRPRPDPRAVGDRRATAPTGWRRRRLGRRRRRGPPFDGRSFDCVVSAFGVQFAPRHQVVADELARVCRPGGRIGVVDWTPEGQVGELFRIMGRYLRPRPTGPRRRRCGATRSTCASSGPGIAATRLSPDQPGLQLLEEQRRHRRRPWSH